MSKASHTRITSGGKATRSSGFVIADGRPADVVFFERAVVDFLVEAAVLLGVPKSVAAIYGICFASPQPLSFSEIAERLNISAGSISQGLRLLREVGALKVATFDTLGGRGRGIKLEAIAQQEAICCAGGAPQVFGRRRIDHYAPDLELRKLILRWLETRLQNELISGQSRLARIADSLPVSLTADRDVLQPRLEALANWYEKASALLPLARTFLRLT